jgi:serine/threonine-protein kinase
MAHAHTHGVVHRDLKPDNLMLTEYADGRPWLKILDFGIARHLVGEKIQLTPTGAELGTPHYMSPEQARGESTVDARADVYALGAILYEALSGQRVHPGTSYNEILFQVITQAHEPLADVLPGCPSGLSSVVERCLAKDPAERPAHAGELLSLLEQLQPSAPAELRPSHSAVMSVSPRARARWQRWLWPLTGIGLGVLVLAVGRREAEAPPISSVVAPCSATESRTAEVGQLASSAAPALQAQPPALVAPEPRSLDTSNTTAQRTPARRARTRPSRAASAPAQPGSSAAATPPRVAPSPSQAGPDLPFATTNPYERP